MILFVAPLCLTFQGYRRYRRGTIIIITPGSHVLSPLFPFCRKTRLGIGTGSLRKWRQSCWWSGRRRRNWNRRAARDHLVAVQSITHYRQTPSKCTQMLSHRSVFNIYCVVVFSGGYPGVILYMYVLMWNKCIVTIFTFVVLTCFCTVFWFHLSNVRVNCNYSGILFS